jgi:hypothetical protein
MITLLDWVWTDGQALVIVVRDPVTRGQGGQRYSQTAGPLTEALAKARSNPGAQS